MQVQTSVNMETPKSSLSSIKYSVCYIWFFILFGFGSEFDGLHCWLAVDKRDTMEFCQRWRAVGVLAGVSSGTGLSGPLARVSQSLAPTQIWSDVIGRTSSFLESDWSTRVPPPVQPPERNFVGKLEWQRRLADNGEDSRPQIFNKYLAKLAQNKSENKLPHSDKSETGESKWRDRNSSETAFSNILYK